MQNQGGGGSGTGSSGGAGGGTFTPRRVRIVLPRSTTDNTRRIKLKGTSQGRQIDIPPDEWIPEELAKFQVRRTQNVQPSNLTGTPHAIFARERWPTLSDDRFKALEQGILLATTLLEIGLPLLTRLIPTIVWRAGRKPQEGSDFGIIETEAGNWTPEDIKKTRTALDEISTRMQWREDGEMLKKRGWWGICSIEFPRPDKFVDMDFDVKDMAEWDENWRDAGLSNRECTIGIASQYIDTLLASEKNSEQHLCAAFHTAVTLVHEICHLVFSQDVANFKPFPMVGQMDPAFGNDTWNELGFALTSRLFDGWYPEPIKIGKDTAYGSFDAGMCWIKQLAGVMTRPIWRMAYSIPFSYVQRLMTQSTWDNLEGKMHSPQDTLAVLSPAWPFQEGKVARTATCLKIVRDGTWIWSGGHTIHGHTYKASPSEDDDEFEADPENPPFEFMDIDWLEIGGSMGKLGDIVGEPTLTEIPKPSFGRIAPVAIPKMLVSVIYAGILDTESNQLSGHTLQDPDKLHSDDHPETAAEGPPKKKRKLIDYSGWPEGVLRDLCLDRKISTLGTRDELVDQLKSFDSAGNMQNLAGGEIAADHWEESMMTEIMNSHEDLAQIHFFLNLRETTVEELKDAIRFITSIPNAFQRILVPTGEERQYSELKSGGDPLSDRTLVNCYQAGKKLDQLMLCRTISRIPSAHPLPVEWLGERVKTVLPYGYIAADLRTVAQAAKWMKKVTDMQDRNDKLREAATAIGDEAALAECESAGNILDQMLLVANGHAAKFADPPPPPGGSGGLLFRYPTSDYYFRDPKAGLNPSGVTGGRPVGPPTGSTAPRLPSPRSPVKQKGTRTTRQTTTGGTTRTRGTRK